MSRAKVIPPHIIGQKFVGQKCRNFGFVSKIFSDENFVQYFNTKVRQKSDKIVEIRALCRKVCPTKNFVRRIFCPILQYKSQTNVGQHCRNFGLMSKILSDEIFCPKKILSDEILSDKVAVLGCTYFMDGPNL